MRTVLALLLATPITFAGPKPGDEGTPEFEKATALVKQLGNPRFAVREAAGKQLLEMGGAAIPALTAGTQSDDEEVRTRSLALLPQVKAVEWKRRAEAFLADPAAHRDLPLLGEWGTLMGKPDIGSRKLYADMLRTNGDLMERADADPDGAPDAVQARARTLMAETAAGRDPVKASVGDLAALFFLHRRAVSVGKGLADWDSEHPAHLLSNPGLAVGLRSPDTGPALRRLVAAWADSRPEDDLVSHQCFVLAVYQAPFPEAVPVLDRLAKDLKAQPLNVRATAIAALGKVGDAPALAALGELVSDSTPLFRGADLCLGDHALATWLAARKLDAAAFGLSQVFECRFRAGRRGTALEVQFRSFPDDAARKKGIQKWKDETAKKDR